MTRVTKKIDETSINLPGVVKTQQKNWQNIDKKKNENCRC
jgi:hypothetical protein